MVHDGLTDRGLTELDVKPGRTCTSFLIQPRVGLFVLAYPSPTGSLWPQL